MSIKLVQTDYNLINEPKILSPKKIVLKVLD